MYFTFQVHNLNITNLSYNAPGGSNTAETGIMLVESIQNFKTYFSQIRLDTEFNITVNFTRMYCNTPVCEEDDYFNVVRF